MKLKNINTKKEAVRAAKKLADDPNPLEIGRVE